MAVKGLKSLHLIMGKMICFDDEQLRGESDSTTADSILTRPCDQTEEGAEIGVAKSVFLL